MTVVTEAEVSPFGNFDRCKKIAVALLEMAQSKEAAVWEKRRKNRI